MMKAPWRKSPAVGLKKTRATKLNGASKLAGVVVPAGSAGPAAAGSDAAALAALRVSEIRYRRLFEAARDGVLLVDPNTRKITDANPFMTELLGYTHAEFVGKEPWEIGLLKDQALSQEMFRVLREKHYVRYEDLPLRSTTGQSHEIEVVANVYREDTQQVIQCNIRDITDRKRAENELVAAKIKNERHAVELEETVRRRTGQLRESIVELEAFSYSISHDMRAPLRSIRGFAEILLEKHSSQLDAEGATFLNKISAAAARMDKLIQEVLGYTQVFRNEVKIHAVDLDTLVRGVVDTYPLFHGKSEIHINGSLPQVMGSEGSLTQCVANLLANAIKFVAPETRPCVNIRAEAIGPDVRLWVEDNGVGIAPEDQIRIFKMFERVSGDGTFEGNGMGLTIVNKAMERMGGQRGVESEAGHGSKFWIQLKRAAV